MCPDGIRKQDRLCWWRIICFPVEYSAEMLLIYLPKHENKRISSSMLYDTYISIARIKLYPYMYRLVYNMPNFY
jgi:hypothetical protein